MTSTGPLQAAETVARMIYERDPFDKYMDITVIEISDDGTETQHEFTVDVEYPPTFSARKRS